MCFRAVLEATNKLYALALGAKVIQPKGYCLIWIRVCRLSNRTEFTRGLPNSHGAVSICDNSLTLQIIPQVPLRRDNCFTNVSIRLRFIILKFHVSLLPLSIADACTASLLCAIQCHSVIWAPLGVSSLCWRSLFPQHSAGSVRDTPSVWLFKFALEQLFFLNELSFRLLCAPLCRYLANLASHLGRVAWRVAS